MKKINVLVMFCLLLHYVAHSQQKKMQENKVGTAKEFIDLVNKQQTTRSTSFTIPLYFPEGTSLNGKVNLHQEYGKETILIGSGNDQTSNFRFVVANGKVTGDYTSLSSKKSIEYFTNEQGELIAKEVHIDEKICIEYEKNNEIGDDLPKNQARIAASQPDLQSLPTSPYVIYIDMDGETSKSRWAGGQTINAVAMGFTQDQMKQIWELVSEDFSPFNVNVTTNRAVYDATPITKRMMAICTKTTTAAPGAGGVAYIDSFSWNEDVPAWVFNTGVKACAETVSHEIGHTLGLEHDGTTSGDSYYSGHGNWAAIMGNSMTKTVTHWSKGEYANANQKQDDLAIIAGSKNGFGYKNDDYANTPQTAKTLKSSSNGTVNTTDNQGIIERTTDVDVFKIISNGNGTINLKINPHPIYPNLNIKAVLTDATGNEITVSSPTNSLSATINTTVSAGTYYLTIDGVGDGANPSVGYSDYNSMGVYSISGTIPPPISTPIADFKTDVSQGCQGVKVQFTDISMNTPTQWNWVFEGGKPATSTEQNPIVEYQKGGKYSATLTVINNFGKDVKTITDVIDVIEIPMPQVENQKICIESINEITFEENSLTDYEIKWFKEANDEEALAIGNKFTATVVGDTSFYVQSSSLPMRQKIGHSSPNIGATNHGGGFFLVFDAKETFMLRSALVKATGTKNRTLQVRNADGQVLLQKEIMIQDGESRILIDMQIPTGENLQIGFASGADLFRTNTGLTYPYEIKDVLVLTGSTAPQPQDYYYYLYDMEIEIASTICVSDLVKVEVLADVCSFVQESENNWKVYPNPIQDFMEITAPITTILKVYDNQGNVVLQTFLNEGENYLKTNDLQAGIYFLEMDSIRLKVVKY